MKYTHVALIASILVSACGNETDAKLGAKVAKSISASIFKRKKKSSGHVSVTNDQVQLVLSEQPKPVFFARIPSRGTISILVETSKSAGYTTYFTSYVESITARNGMITATRGIGGDLMSSSVDQNSSLLTNTQEGSAVRTMRHIGKNERIEELRFDCEIKKGATYRYDFGEISTKVTEMIERCNANGLEFTNNYLIDATGFAVKSSQWLSPTFGKLETEFLRN